MKIRKGDTVKILSGKDRGKTAKVFRVYPKEERILVEGLNLKKKHVRSKRQDKKGEVVLIPAPFPVSKAILVCPSCKKPARVGYKIKDPSQKTRVCKKCGNEF
ncbi:MAG: 50S ribosomal protein L24 [Candidatus Sungbacteria bacterium]|nr:50S ribosomal protein L24 [Candidatus Sungbacteria bacterium]